MGSQYLCCKREKEDDIKTDTIKENSGKQITNDMIINKNKINYISKHITILSNNQDSNYSTNIWKLKDMKMDEFSDRYIKKQFLICLREAIVFNKMNNENKSDLFMFLNEDCIFYNNSEDFFFCKYESNILIYLDNQNKFKEYIKNLKDDDDRKIQISPIIVSLVTTFFKEEEIKDKEGSNFYICHSIGMLFLKFIKKIKKEKLIKINKQIAKSVMPDIDNVEMQELLLTHCCFMDIIHQI